MTEDKVKRKERNQRRIMEMRWEKNNGYERRMTGIRWDKIIVRELRALSRRQVESTRKQRKSDDRKESKLRKGKIR